MVRSLWTGATGMQAMQFHIDAIANDLANVNTNGYHKKHVNFQDLLYQTVRAAGVQGGDGVNWPVGIQVGHGVVVGGTTPVMKMGAIVETTGQYDLALIEPEGLPIRSFFRVSLPNDGGYAYTRDGNFRRTVDGYLATTDGMLLSDFTIDDQAENITISFDGTVWQKLPGVVEPQQAGQINVYTFTNPAGLTAIGGNRYVESPSSGEPVENLPGADGAATIRQGTLETSNTDAITEMVNMIAAQRAYEFNSRSIQTSDEMLQTINTLKR